MEPIRILIADDHRHFRDGLRALLLSAHDVEVVGEAGTVAEAVALVVRTAPGQGTEVRLEVPLP